MTVHELAKMVWKLWIDTEEFLRDGYSAEEAQLDIKLLHLCKWDLPDGITPEQLVAAVNDVIMEALDAEYPPDEARRHRAETP